MFRHRISGNVGMRANKNFHFPVMWNKITNASTVNLLIILIFWVNDAFSNAADTEITTTNFLPACSGYNKHSTNLKPKETSLPTANRSKQDATFTLTLPTVTGEKNFQLRESKKLKCTEDEAETRIIPLDMKLNTKEFIPRNFKLLRTGSTEAHSHSYFATSGHFYDRESSNYYKPDGDYCVKSYAFERQITLKVCAVNKDCSSSSNKNAWCLPKCCAADEVLIYWKRTCKRTSEITLRSDGITPWIPPVYEGPKNPNRKLDGVQNNLIFHMATLPKDCNLKIWKDESKVDPYKRLIAFSVTHPTANHTDKKDDVKLAAPSHGSSTGMIHPMVFFATSRRWKVIDDWAGFCMDGFFVDNSKQKLRRVYYTGEENNYLVYHCDNVKENDVEKVYTLIYFLVCLLSLFFLLIAVVVYLLLWEKQNLHGLTTLNYLATTFLAYLFFGVAHFVTLFEIELDESSPLCYGIAALVHYFLLSGYLWMTVLNFDLYRTFKSVRPVKAGEKEWKKLGWYSLVAWVVPLLLVIAFVIVDTVYSDPYTEVPVPDYGKHSCFVSVEFRGEYVYIPIAVILVTNLVLIFLTIKILLDAKRKMARFSGGVSNANRYSLKLFLKLFLVMGGTSIVDFVTWYYNNSDDKPWLSVAIESMSYLISTVALFVIYCLNDKVLNQLQEKFPVLRDVFQPVLKLFSKQEEYSTTTNRTGVSTANTVERDVDNTAARKNNEYEPIE